MIRHYVARRAKVTEDHPHDAEMSALFYGVLTWIVTFPALTTSLMASAATLVVLGGTADVSQSPHMGPGGSRFAAGRLGGRPCPGSPGYMPPGRVGRDMEPTPVVLSLVSQRSAQATCSARSLIPRSIFWLITKLTASTGSTRNRAHGRV
jgi:hypothetical protein